MAITFPPLTCGSVVTLRGPRGATLMVRAPDGLELRQPAPTGRADLWLPQVGEWTYSWDVGGSGTLTVLPAPAEHAETVDEAPPAFTYMPGGR